MPPSGRVPLINREQSLLAFNQRVLAQSQRADVPLLERLRYICIVASNLDEFFEVRFADTLEALRDPKGGGSRRELAGVSAAAHALMAQQYEVFNTEAAERLREIWGA